VNTPSDTICFFDCEATGIEPLEARITQLAWIICDLETQDVLRVGMRYVYTDKELDPEVVELTGITNDLLNRAGSDLKDVLFKFKDDMQIFGVKYICAHNLNNYDLKLVNAECERVGLTPLDGIAVDTKTDLDLPPTIRTRSLLHLAAEHGFIPIQSHDALQDCYTMKKLFFMYDYKSTVATAQVPTITIHIKTNYDQREIAKKLSYRWDAPTKRWLKEIKENKLQEEIEKAQGVEVVRA